MRVMILAPWPFRVPRNGGQIRGAAVAQAYRDANHTVHIAALYDASRVPADSVWPGDVPILPGVVQAMEATPAPAGGKASALVFWEAVAAAPDSFAAFTARVRAAQPDLLQIEEPFLWPVVRRLKAHGLLDGVPVILSAYNFEAAAWRDLQTAGAPVSDSTFRDIAALEREIAVSCDLVITVSESDAREFRALGAARVEVAGNGASSPQARRDTTVLDAYLPPGMAHALFVSSAHPPNAHGLVELAAMAVGHPIRHGEILIGGQVGALVRAAPRFREAGRVLERARFLGWVSDDLLHALYASTRVVILPKTLGGGSNLKTAEALASGRPIVATRLAFEGFEAFADLPGVTIEDEPNRFWEAVDALLSSAAGQGHRSAEAMSGLLWQESLKPMVRAVEDIVRRKSQSRVTRQAAEQTGAWRL